MTDPQHSGGRDEFRRLREDLAQLERTVYGADLAPGLPEQVRQMRTDLDRLEKALEMERAETSAEFAKHVTMERFRPTERLVLGAVALFGAALIGGIVTWILSGGLRHPTA